MDAATRPLLTDLYQLNMIQAYLDQGETKTAIFEFLVRKLPARRGFLVAAGLQPVLDFLESLHFSNEELEWLRRNSLVQLAVDVDRRLARQEAQQ